MGVRDHNTEVRKSRGEEKRRCVEVVGALVLWYYWFSKIQQWKNEGGEFRWAWAKDGSKRFSRGTERGDRGNGMGEKEDERKYVLKEKVKASLNKAGCGGIRGERGKGGGVDGARRTQGYETLKGENVGWGFQSNPLWVGRGLKGK